MWNGSADELNERFSLPTLSQRQNKFFIYMDFISCLPITLFFTSPLILDIIIVNAYNSHLPKLHVSKNLDSLILFLRHFDNYFWAADLNTDIKMLSSLYSAVDLHIDCISVVHIWKTAASACEYSTKSMVSCRSCTIVYARWPKKRGVRLNPLEPPPCTAWCDNIL